MLIKTKENKMDLNEREISYLITNLALEHEDEIKHYGYLEEKKSDFVISYHEGRKIAEEKLKNSFSYNIIRKLQKLKNNL